ncbi:hypothetical protein WH47_11311 [Habropoda laboriosa]|uniref:Uncharacterized protein n=1 Tax=Habropoda laboriosa TaxID=597456 RepID=A0A0L7QKX4_9HYME|nr:PREDICTED: uncharacterized protein LOC108577912 [Habropoda laboriosa]XP_017796630.1 PREDICTED: uncharacterized protein LOC108577912 [Habropoda laboriosa]KOC59235.1 hypothetical protein WH47_11311 [Habropoda laboriosa]
MWLPKICTLLILLASTRCEKEDDEDASTVFIEAAKTFFSNKDNLNGLQGLAKAFLQSDSRGESGDMFSSTSNLDSVGQIVSGIGSLFSNGQNNQGIDFSMLGSVLDGVMNSKKNSKRTSRSVETKQRPSIDLEGILNVGSMFMSQSGNSDLVMGLLPMLLSKLGGESNEMDDTPDKMHDHSGHSWYMPPILENLHVMWDHFSNSELGQTLWRKSGLADFVGQMSDPEGRIRYEKLLDSFEKPAVRRAWIRSLTNYIGEWISHVSDPQIQQRYLNTVQFVGNSFLKSQGFPKAAMFDSMRPVESLSRLVNAMGKRHLGMKMDSSQYIKPAVSYVKELIALASEKGFIMSRVNAREISNRLSDMINNDIVNPILKSFRAYKWAIKRPECASQVLCTINEKNEQDKDQPLLRSGLLKITSFPAAWAVSNSLGSNFWTVYGAIMEHDGCILKYPADCTDFHEEEVRITTENVHSEL